MEPQEISWDQAIESRRSTCWHCDSYSGDKIMHGGGGRNHTGGRMSGVMQTLGMQYPVTLGTRRRACTGSKASSVARTSGPRRFPSRTAPCSSARTLAPSRFEAECSNATKNDDERKIVVFDLEYRKQQISPTTITALSLAPMPGLAAVLAVMTQEGLTDDKFLNEQCVGWEDLRPLLDEVDVTDYARVRNPRRVEVSRR